MDLTKNNIPGNVKRVHLIAICGTAMGALACMLKEKGYHVTGSDHKMYPPMSDFLKVKGVEIMEGFSQEHLDGGPDLVVVGNAVSKDNPEVVGMFERGLPFCSMPQAVNHFLAKGKKTVVIAGTHGKTTTSSLMAWMLDVAGLSPSFLIGGILKNYSSNFKIGTGPFLVLEGDEYDTAFFDKGAKFLHYAPDYSIVTSVEFDHADIFRDLDHVKSVFKRFIDLHKQGSVMLAWDSDTNLDELTAESPSTVERYGTGKDSAWALGKVDVAPPWTVFEVFKHKALFRTFRSPLPGMHNLLNTLSVIAVGDHIGIEPDTIAKALETFQGVRRRQDVRGVEGGVTVMDDFAHHPTAVRETIKAVKPFFTQGRLIAVFEPRTNSSMRDVFQAIYPKSFDGADLVCIRKPPLLSKIPENQRFSSEKLVTDLIRNGIKAFFFDDTEGIIEFLVGEAKPGDLVLVMSNGGFDNIHERLLKAFREPSERG